MTSSSDRKKLDEVQQHHDPKAHCYGECDLQYITVDVMNEDGVIEEVPAHTLPETEPGPWWVRALRWLVVCR